MHAPCKSIPYPVIQRFAKYLLLIIDLKAKGIKFTFSHLIANALGITSQTVRGDLLYLNFSGRTKKGYEITKLEKALKKTLDINKEKRAVIVGAGNMGRGLILHKDFIKFGFNICAIFDSNPKKVGKRIGCFSIKSMDSLYKTIKSNGVTIGIITVPPEAAQQVADQLIACGVTGLLNFTNLHIKHPKNVSVIGIYIAGSLLELSGIMCLKNYKKEKTAISA